MTDTHKANGCEFIVADDMIVRWLRRNTTRTFEPVTTDWMLEVIEEKDGAFVDVGVSTGWFAIPMAKRGVDVIAFEPNARVRARLLENCRINGVEITLHAAAASQFGGQATFHYNRTLPLTSGGSIQCRPTEDALSETVRTVRIDDVVSGNVALMKVDVEGHEEAVLAGAMETIEASRPYLVLEANSPDHRAKLAEWLAQNGYTFADADERNMLCSPLS